ncbi:MAG: hypothetical protein KDK36_19930 [Leptospiraceae bacterium]|nr:hypothetical protein [Leptospiraceae bacterium]
MDLKKVKVTGVIDFIDRIIEKIPDRVKDALRKFVLVIYGITILYVAYVFYLKGKSEAVQEGQDLAKDTKMLFYMDVERSHNMKKRAGVRYTSNSDLLSDDKYKVEKQYVTPPSATDPTKKTMTEPSSKLMDRDEEMKPSRNPVGGNILDTSPESMPVNEPSTIKKEKKAPLVDMFETNKELETGDYYSKTLNESVGRSKILKKKTTGEVEDSNDPSVLKNETPKKSSKKGKMITPGEPTNPGGETLLPIGN